MRAPAERSNRAIARLLWPRSARALMVMRASVSSLFFFAILGASPSTRASASGGRRNVSDTQCARLDVALARWWLSRYRPKLSIWPRPWLILVTCRLDAGIDS